jgi:DegV family protein with EDD domain
VSYCIIVDSSSKIKNGDIKDVYVVPLTLTKITGKQSFTLRDGVDFKTKQMLTDMQKGVEYKTASPAMGACVELLDDVTKKYDDVYVLSLAKTLSGTFNQWNLLANEYKNVHVFDTNTIGRMFNWMIDDISKLSTVNVKNVGDVINAYINKANISVIVGDLKYLVHGGRISSFKGYIATLLKFKIVVSLKKDGLKLVGKTSKLENLSEIINENFKKQTDYNGKNIEKIVIFTSGVEDKKFDVSPIVNLLKKNFSDLKIEYSELPSVIAAHVGPSYVAVAIKVK